MAKSTYVTTLLQTLLLVLAVASAAPISDQTQDTVHPPLEGRRLRLRQLRLNELSHTAPHAAPVDRVHSAATAIAHEVAEATMMHDTAAGQDAVPSVAERDTGHLGARRVQDRLFADMASTPRRDCAPRSKTRSKGIVNGEAKPDRSVPDKDGLVGAARGAAVVLSRQHNHTSAVLTDSSSKKLPLPPPPTTSSDSTASQQKGRSTILHRLRTAVLRSADFVGQCLQRGRSRPGTAVSAARSNVPLSRVRRSQSVLGGAGGGKSLQRISEPAAEGYIQADQQRRSWMTLAGAGAGATCLVLVLFGMARPRQRQSAGAEQEHIAASDVDMFEDRFKPTLFTMQQWTELRDNLFYGGLPHRENTSHPCHSLFKVAKALNLIQQHYVFRPGTPDGGMTVVGVKGRHVAEVSVKFLLRPEVLNALPARASLHDQISALRDDGGDRELVNDLHTLRKKSNGSAHDTDDFRPEIKTDIADAAFRVGLKVWASAMRRFPEVAREAARRTAAAANAVKQLNDARRQEMERRARLQWEADEPARLQREAEARRLKEVEKAACEEQEREQWNEEQRNKRRQEERERRQRDKNCMAVFIWALLALPYGVMIFLISIITGGGDEDDDEEEERPTICGCTNEYLDNPDHCSCCEDEGNNNCAGVCLRAVFLVVGMLTECVIELLVRMAFALAHAVAVQPTFLQRIREVIADDTLETEPLVGRSTNG